MRIEFNYRPEALAEVRGSGVHSCAATQNAARGGTLESPAVGQDQVQLSGAHVQVERLAAQAMHLPEVREDRVEALGQAVESGKYHPDAEHVARALILHMMARLSA